MKTIFRSNNKGNFTCISNSILQSGTLAPDEMGLLVRLLSLPENFIINKTSFWKSMNIGREHFNRIWNNLAKHGYIKTTKIVDVKSKHFEYTHTVHEIPVPQIPVSQKPVNGKLVSLIIDNKKETGKNHEEKNKEEKNKQEKENGEFGPKTGSERENDTPTYFVDADIKSNETSLTIINATIPAPFSSNDEKSFTKDTKKQKVLNLDFLKKVKDVLAFMEYEELVEHLNGEFQDSFPLSQFEKYQLGVIVNSK